MITEEFNIIIFVTGIIIGCIATLAFKSFSSKNSAKSSNPAANVASFQSLQQELDKKQVMIDNFFSDSDQQLQAAEKRLAELRQNISSGAKQLSNITITPPPVSSTQDAPQVEQEEVTAPPRDYAVKTADDEGMLSEKFGLPQGNEELEPKRTI